MCVPGINLNLKVALNFPTTKGPTKAQIWVAKVCLSVHKSIHEMKTSCFKLFPAVSFQCDWPIYPDILNYSTPTDSFHLWEAVSPHPFPLCPHRNVGIRIFLSMILILPILVQEFTHQTCAGCRLHGAAHDLVIIKNMDYSPSGPLTAPSLC